MGTAKIIPNEFIKTLDLEFPKNFYSLDPQQLEKYGKDWTQGFTANAGLVVFPENTQQVSEFLKLCSKHKMAVVPSGGRTGLAAAATAVNGEAILSLDRMNKISEFNFLTQTVRVESGVINEALQEFLQPKNMCWPIELASKGSCTVGGNLATNAGGLRVIRYGHAKQWVLSLQVVLISGEILELNGELHKNNTGYNFCELMIGSEGTLAVITAATLKLTPLIKDRSLFLFAVEDFAQIMQLLSLLRQQQHSILGFEVFNSDCLKIVTEHRSLPQPFAKNYPWNILVELENTAAIENLLELIFEQGLAQDGRRSLNSKEHKLFWDYRECITESLAALGSVFKNDLAFPLGKLHAFINELQTEQKNLYPNAKVFYFGHMGDGNIHINVVKTNAEDPKKFFDDCLQANHSLFSLVKKYGGSIAAEHGIGLLKKDFLCYAKTATEINLMKSIKRQLDPDNLLNPGKIFDL